VTKRLGVGILGAGPVTQAIHLPTLARLGDRFRLVSVMDIDRNLAESVARRAGTRVAGSVDEVLGDPEVEVVAVCSPDRFHVDQVAAICAAGKLGILCEKPAAITAAEAERLGAIVAAMPFVVGTMHPYDPAWLEAIDEVGEQLSSAHSIRSTIILPFNRLFEDVAAEIVGRPTFESGSAADEDTEETLIRSLVLGLWIHDLPLIRPLAPSIIRIDHAKAIEPLGATISLAAAGRRVELAAYMRPLGEIDWRLEAWGEDWSLRAHFPPSYIHAGSARVTIREAGGTRVFESRPGDGYDGEWVELHDQVVSGKTARYAPEALVEDVCYATEIAAGAVAALSGGGS
jgi:myo-inositol 2-dehydrogenase/D-chiro-inositol 1-dehydrogenase